MFKEFFKKYNWLSFVVTILGVVIFTALTNVFFTLFLVCGLALFCIAKPSVLESIKSLYTKDEDW